MPQGNPDIPIWPGLKAVDWSGSLLIVGGTLMLLSFGGVTFAWNSATVINLIIFGVFTGSLFGLNEWKRVKYPVIPPRLFHIWGAGPLLPRVYLLPFILFNTGMAAATGVYIQQSGKYIPAVYLGLVLMTIGTGLLIDFDAEANWPKIIICQLLVGSVAGLNFEGTLLALQASLDVQDVATATAIMGFTRMPASADSLLTWYQIDRRLPLSI
ncbi:efflux pump antibiotic resistance [Colletotrichum incanum]|uniref:Efflux pump antibiotic resistance n=1 Tax=Colletotrichum incanum TaxID=1573173 RepID=A0A161YDW6_COLIC|nr:efflux pump antibiotic resistance [Colletotrichum incanum]OHW97192.1 MFS drug transporter [Colletotrichum incanum]